MDKILGERSLRKDALFFVSVKLMVISFLVVTFAGKAVSVI